MQGMERRTTRRLNCENINATVECEGRTDSVVVKDVGAGGVLVDTSATDARFFQGQTFTVTLLLEAFGTIESSCRVRWYNPIARTAGCKFISLEAERRKSLEAFIEARSLATSLRTIHGAA
ncbi:MAG: hypothetical protein ACI81R_001257 [Bradymonadia bacterium]|jgi:hypothetical protein